ncbi:hypothetical protein PNP85_14925, partial [Halobacterium salinarum]|uniref:hypothetical protein n=1 Tax=Halobacterium salinarum TaxID=2242 RepID=UPI002552CAF0
MRLSEYSPGDIFLGGLGTSLIVLTGVGVAVGFNLDPFLQNQHSLFSYLSYLFVVGGLGGFLALGWLQGARITTVASTVVIMGLIVTNAPERSRSVIHLNSILGIASGAVPLVLSLEYAGRNLNRIRSVYTPDAIRFGALTGAVYSILALTVRGLLGFYEGGFISTVFTSPAQIGITVWSITGLF